MAAPVTLVDSGGFPVSEAPDGLGVAVTPTDNAVPVTLIDSGGMAVIFVGIDGTLWPGGVAP